MSSSSRAACVVDNALGCVSIRSSGSTSFSLPSMNSFLHSLPLPLQRSSSTFSEPSSSSSSSSSSSKIMSSIPTKDAAALLCPSWLLWLESHPICSSSCSSALLAVVPPSCRASTRATLEESRSDTSPMDSLDEDDKSSMFSISSKSSKFSNSSATSPCSTEEVALLLALWPPASSKGMVASLSSPPLLSFRSSEGATLRPDFSPPASSAP
mmetsp:Transcript_12901/g.27822  ORF Transcript_12901/g.27822 Transcript_12901/m.27822 type:complete len:211 (-) Transcript_12901:867-1499(-)